MAQFARDSSLEGGGFELPVPLATQVRFRAKIAGVGCMPPSVASTKSLSEISKPYRARNRKFEFTSPAVSRANFRPGSAPACEVLDDMPNT